MSEFVMPKMTEINFRLRRDSSDHRGELVKEHGKPFLVSDYMKLDLYADSKLNIWVKDDIIKEEALLIKICEALSKASRTKKRK